MNRQRKFRSAWTALAAVALLICYASTLRGMLRQWRTDQDMSYAFIVPAVIAWILWKERARWRKLPVRPSAWGFGLLALGACLQVASAFGAGLFAASVAFVISLAGIVLVLFGVAWLRAWAFLFLLALFMLPKLAIVYNQVTLPLQLLASRLAAGMLSIAGFMVIRNGNILNVAGYSIEVVEACNGIRYLLPLAFLALVIAYVGGGGAWIRSAMLAAAIPIAILANGLRVAFSGVWRALASGAPHELLGTFIFLLSLGLLAGIHALLARTARYNRTCKTPTQSSLEPGTTA